MLSLVFRTKQIPCTLVKVWYQSDDTSKSKLSTYSIHSRNYAVSMEARATGINGYVFLTLWKMEKRKLHIYFLTKQKPY